MAEMSLQLMTNWFRFQVDFLLFQVAHATLHSLQIDCTWSEWSSWADCSASCGQGQVGTAQRCEVLVEGRASRRALF